MQLFQNRAGLKKAYADLQGEFHLLRDRLKQQEGSTIRVQEQLDALGDLLGDPVSGFSALVFFQLRMLWKTAHQQIEGFVGDLTRQQEARETANHQADMQELRASRLRQVEQRLESAAMRADEERGRLSALQAEYARRTAFWHYFTRRKLQRQIDSQRVEMAAADAVVGDLHAEHSALEAEPLAEFAGLSLEARRTINLAAIGYAELLCERLAVNGLVARVKDAVTRRVHEMNFGDRAQCEAAMQEIQKALAAVRSQAGVAAQVKSKIERYRAACSYRNVADTVPSADSLNSMPPSDGGGAPPVAAINVLAEDYWDLYALLLR